MASPTEGSAPPPPPPNYLEDGNTTQAENAPPRYNNDAPPSYESIFGKFRQLRDKSDGKADFGKRLFGSLFCSTACGIVMTVFMLAIPISCLVFGSLYLGQCPREKYIPIYLIVAGVFGVFKGILGVVQMIKKKQDSGSEDDDEPGKGSKAFRIIEGPIICFLTAWFIAGSVWVYRIYGDYSTDPGSPDYCQPTLYLFAFWILTIQYILLLLSICCCCITLIVVCCTTSSSD